MKRRTFMKNTALGSLALGFGSYGATGKQEQPVPQRMLGKTGEKLSVIGFGGIMLNDNPQEFANNLVAGAFEAGINYFDVAPSYGNAQDRMGPALRPYRNKSFLACKTTRRDATGAESELNGSLKALQTDHFDLYQLHALTTVEDVDQAFASGGAMEVFIHARKEGRVRFIGFSAHSVEAATLAMSRFDFDTILFPINFNCWQQGDFGPQVFELAASKGMGILALKAMAHTLLKQGEAKMYKNVWYRPVEEEPLARLALRYTLSKPVTAAIPPGDEKFFRIAVETARNFTPLTTAESQQLERLATGNPPVFSHHA